MKIIWTPRALARVREIADYIARDRPKVAQRWALSVFDRVERLATSPKRGRMVPEARREEIREILHGKYRIIYRLDEDAVVSILTVRHGSRLFDSREIED
ncbi:MAG: type II toxin-antitoxin system RelE/ParE family toxin [bacterium]|nr:type II toxin-antitoxin system RelE/ParE family toxin [bacterium]